MNDPGDKALRNLKQILARDPLLRDLIDPSLTDAPRAARFTPDVDVLESEAGWELLVDLPGLRPEQVQVEIEGARLVVSGDRPDLRGGQRARVAERSHGPFKREFLLPFAVSQESIRARLADGVLRIHLPRVGAASGPRRVAVETEGSGA